MAREPDAKDWTWVLERACPECGFDASALPADEVASLSRTTARAWAPVLAEAPELLRRAVGDRWSPLEYACHVRDVFALYDERLQRMLAEDNPTFANWDQDVTAAEARYNEQDPSTVSAQLEAAAAALAATFDTVSGASWERRGLRSDGAAFTVATFGRYMIHDPIHHLHDVTGDFVQLKA
jgi:hypothetical protein